MPPPPPLTQAQEGSWGDSKYRSFIDTTDESNKNIDFGTATTNTNTIMPRWMSSSNRQLGSSNGRSLHSRHHTNIIEVNII